LGWHCELVLRGRDPVGEGNTLLDQLFGAQVTAVEPRRYTEHLDSLLEQRAEHHRSQGRHPLIIPTGGSNGLGIWGYVSGAEELVADMAAADITNATIVTATGSGGTQAGLTLGMALFQPDCSVWGFAVCDDEQYFTDKVSDDICEAQGMWSALACENIQINTNDAHVGPGYGRATEPVYERIAALASLEGIVLDPVYTGKAFHGLCEELAQGAFPEATDIIFVHTGGIYGIFPHGQQLAAAASHPAPWVNYFRGIFSGSYYHADQCSCLGPGHADFVARNWDFPNPRAEFHDASAHPDCVSLVVWWRFRTG
jgi:D-cysteine desulfhydrase